MARRTPQQEYVITRARRAAEKAEAEAVQQYSDKICPYCNRKMEINMHYSCRACQKTRLSGREGMEDGVRLWLTI